MAPLKLHLPAREQHYTCRATLENDRTGRQAAVRPRPGSGWTDCPVANTERKSIMSHHTSDNINSFNPTKSFNNMWNNCTVADEKSKILDWLSPREPQRRRQDIRTRRIDEVGNWLWLRNMGIDLVVSVEQSVIVQLCFATGVRGWARHTLGRRSHT